MSEPTTETPPASSTLVTPPATTPPANTTESPAYIGTDGAFVEGWTDRLPEDMGDSRTALGKFKNIGDLGKSYVELQKKLGTAATAVFVPGKDATPEQVAAFRTAIGAFGSVEDYAKLKPENLPAGVDWNDELAKPLFELAHKHGVPASAVQDYLNLRVQQEGQRAQAIHGEIEKQLKEGDAELRRDWGKEYEPNIQRVIQAAKLAGIDPMTAPGFRDAGTVKAFLRLANKLGDDTWQSGGEGTDLNSPHAQAKDIMTNPNNPEYELYQNRNPDTVAKVNELMSK